MRWRAPPAVGRPGCLRGLAAGAIGLVILFFVINAVASRLPLRAVFIVTSALLFLMAIKMIGDAILEFQEQLIVPSNPIASLGWIPKTASIPPGKRCWRKAR